MFAGVKGLILRSTLGVVAFRVVFARKNLGIFASLSLALLLNLSYSTVGFAKVKATTTASEKNNYARIILDFNDLPKYESKIDDTILVVRFSEHVDLNLSKLIQQLPNYIGVARVDPDGRAFRLAFINSFKVNIMEAGSKVFIDILGVGWQGLPPNLPQDVVREITKRAAEIEARNKEAEKQQKKSKDIFSSNLRVGELPTFTRLSFEWNRFVTAKLVRQGQQINLTFGQPIEIDVGRVKINPPKYLADIKSSVGKLSSSVELKVKKGVKVRGFREGNNYLIDLSPSDAQLSKQLDELANKVAGEEKALADSKKPGPEEVELVVLDEAPKKKADIDEKADEIEVVRSKFTEFNPDVFDLEMFGDEPDKGGLPAVRIEKIDAGGALVERLRAKDKPDKQRKSTKNEPQRKTEEIRRLAEKPYLETHTVTVR